MFYLITVRINYVLRIQIYLVFGIAYRQSVILKQAFDLQLLAIFYSSVPIIQFLALNHVIRDQYQNCANEYINYCNFDDWNFTQYYSLIMDK